jgi:hypothetical protein
MDEIKQVFGISQAALDKKRNLDESKAQKKKYRSFK